MSFVAPAAVPGWGSAAAAAALAAEDKGEGPSTGNAAPAIANKEPPTPAPRCEARRPSSLNGADDGKQRAAMVLPPLIAPLRFGSVAQMPDAATMQKEAIPAQVSAQQWQSVYKGSCPRPRHLPFLRRLRIKTILSLTPKPLASLDKNIAAWAEEHGIRLVHVHCDKPKDDGGGLSREAAAKALLVSQVWLWIQGDDTCQMLIICVILPSFPLSIERLGQTQSAHLHALPRWPKCEHPPRRCLAQGDGTVARCDCR